MNRVKKHFQFAAVGTALALLVSLLAIPSACVKDLPEVHYNYYYNTIDADSLAQVILDSLSKLYNAVEIYKGADAGGQTSGLTHVTNGNNPYTGANHYLTVCIPGGLRPGDKVFASGEVRLSRDAVSFNDYVTPQSLICLTKDINTQPTPATPQSNLVYLCSNFNESWDLTVGTWHPIDRSGVFEVSASDNTWHPANAYVNLYARVAYGGNGTLNSTFNVGATSLSVIVVRD